MKFFGHPLHVILIHFPSAMFPMDLVCSGIVFFGGPHSLTSAAYFATLGGVCLGWLALVTGAIDLLPVVKHKPHLVNKVLIHGGLNGLVVIAFSVVAMNGYRSYPELKPDSLILLGVKTFLLVIMFVGNFLGGSLVLKDRLGSQQ